MLALFFPHLDALRLVLASGVVPTEVTTAPARAGFDPHGRLWLEPDALPRRDALAGLARFGVQALGRGEALTEGVNAWAELLPLRSVPIAPATLPGQILFELPDGQVAKLVRDLCRRRRHPIGVRLLPTTGAGRAWVTSSGMPPLEMLLRFTDKDSLIEPFMEQSPGVWVRVGWEHPLPNHLPVPRDQLLLLRPPRGVVACPGPVPLPVFEDYPVRGSTTPTPTRVAIPPIPVRLSLKHKSEWSREMLWVFPGTAAGEFWEFCRSGNERVVRQFETATVSAGGEMCLVVRPAPGKRLPPPLPLVAAGYCPDPRVPGLYLPAARSLQPIVRARELRALLGHGPDRLTWLTIGSAGGVVSHCVSLGSFRPVSAALEYIAPRAIRLPAVPPRAEPFAFDSICPTPHTEDQSPIEPEYADEPAEVGSAGATSDDHPGWLSRSLERLAGRFRRLPRSAGGNKGGEVGLTSSAQPTTSERRPVSRPTTPERVEEKLASADALLHGRERAARRHELESQLLREFPQFGPDRRAGGWAELAAVYIATGNPADAAVSWINASWEADPTPEDWLEQWFLAECRAAKQPSAVALDRWLGEPGRLGNARVVAAYTAWAGRQTPPPGELLAALPQILALLDQQFDDLPARAVWLARVAVTRLCDGDALGLARWRDRVLARLREKGPGLDLDEPSFLRFHGTAAPDRFQTAREWLTRVRKPILDWIGRLGSAGRLQWAGLDPETDCTAAYAQLMLAWGLGCLGERSRSLDWAARARKLLTRAVGPGVDPAVHRLLADAFQSRIRDVQEGRPARPGLPPDLLASSDQLPVFSRYAVDRLRDSIRILEPVGRGRAFRGLDLREFRGQDLLGERLQVFADRTDPVTLADEARGLLDVCAADSSSMTVPRTTQTLLDAASHLPGPLVKEVLTHVVPACTWLETWLQAGRWTDAERAECLPNYLGRILSQALAAATFHNLWSDVRGVADYLTRRAGSDPALRSAVIASAGSLFRSLRKLGYRTEAEALLPILDPGCGEWPVDVPFPPARLGLAIGWFAISEEDFGNRILNDARLRLFVARVGDDRERTELAIAYAEALGFAPPRIALGRLEEIFQLLDRVTTAGSTNRYYTLKPLQLIDAVVRAVVTDDFALGPAVRGWLDDDEFLIRRRIHRDMAAALREEGLRAE